MRCRRAVHIVAPQRNAIEKYLAAVSALLLARPAAIA